MAQNEVQLELLRQRLVRESSDFNTVDAYRLLDKNAECEVAQRDLAMCLVNDIQIDQKYCNIRSLNLIAPKSF